MIPTSYLRFVRRNTLKDIGNYITVTSEVRVLQQWWADHSCDVYIPDNPGGSVGEWRDVELVNEIK